MKILCTNFHASIIKCTNLIFIAAKQPDYDVTIASVAIETVLSWWLSL